MNKYQIYDNAVDLTKDIEIRMYQEYKIGDLNFYICYCNYKHDIGNDLQIQCFNNIKIEILYKNKNYSICENEENLNKDIIKIMKKIIENYKIDKEIQEELQILLVN